MLVAEYTGNQGMDVRERDVVEPGPGQVRIDVAYVGICGTDLHVLHGAMDARVTLPQSIGHEMSGRIGAIGSDVEGWAVGDRVTVMPLLWDGTCPACRAGHQHICQNLVFVGIDSPGALQQGWVVEASTLVRIPASLSLEHAALAEPVAVAVHDVRRAGLTAHDSVVVLGGGPIGLLIACVARSFDARVVVAEIDPARRQTLSDLGFEVVDPSSEDVSARVDAWTDGAGADVVFEVSGAAAAVATATSLAKVRGTIVIVAIHGEPRPVDLRQVFWRELTILGARVYERQDFDTAVALLEAGSIPADTVITSVVPLTEVLEAFRTLERGGAMKVLVDVAGAGA